MLAFSKFKATRVATEISYYAAKRFQDDVHKLKLRNVVLFLRLASSKLQGLQQKCLIMLQSHLKTMSTNWSSKTGSRRQSRKIAFLKRFLSKSLKGKSSIPKSEKLGEKTLLHNLMQISYYARVLQVGSCKGCNRNIVFIFAFSKLKAAKVATEMSCLSLRLASCKLQGLQQKCCVYARV